MSNLSLQQKVNDYLSKTKTEKVKTVLLEPNKPLLEFSEIKDKIPEELRFLIDTYKQQSGFLQDFEIYQIFKKYDFNAKLADAHISVLIHRSKEIDTGEWINVLHKTKARVSKDEKTKLKEKEPKKEPKKEKFAYEEENYDNYDNLKNYRKKDFYSENYHKREDYYGKQDYYQAPDHYQYEKPYQTEYYTRKPTNYHSKYPKNTNRYSENVNNYQVKYIAKNPLKIDDKNLNDYEVLYVPKIVAIPEEKPVKTQENEKIEKNIEKIEKNIEKIERNNEKIEKIEKNNEKIEKIEKNTEKTEEKTEKTDEKNEKNDLKFYDSAHNTHEKPKPKPFKAYKAPVPHKNMVKNGYKGNKKYDADFEVEYVKKTVEKPEEKHKEIREIPQETKPEIIPAKNPKIEDLVKNPQNISIQSLQEKITESLDLKKPEVKKTDEISNKKLENVVFDTNFITRAHSENLQNINNPPIYSQFPVKNFVNNQGINSNNQGISNNNQIQNLVTGKNPPNLMNMGVQLQSNASQGINSLNLPVLYLMMPNGQQIPVLLTPMQMPPNNINNENSGVPLGYLNGMLGKESTIPLNNNIPQFPFVMNYNGNNPMQMNPATNNPLDISAKNLINVENNMQTIENPPQNMNSNFYLQNPNNFFPYPNSNLYYNNK